MITKTPINIKARRSLITGLVAGSFAIFALVGLGMKIEASRQPERLPANQACLAALDGVSKALNGEQVDIQKNIKDCRDSADKYEVVVK